MSCGCGCGNSNCTGGCGCGSTPGSQVILTQQNPFPCGVRPCSPLNPTCQAPLCASPEPFYASVPQCQENHCQQIFQSFFQAAICTQFAFNIPGCGESAQVYFQNVSVLPVGAYLWQANYGYLQVISFNSQTGLAVLLNNCNEGNASPGTSVPACTCFVVTPEPTQTPDPVNTPFVAVDFTAPAISDCLDITVTSINGLGENQTVAIGAGLYTLDHIVSPTIINICNNGSGITPGTVVIAKNSAGQFQYPISVIATNPCDNPSQASGVPMICKSGTLCPLTSGHVGDVLSLTSTVTEVAQYDTRGFDAQNSITSQTTINNLAAAATYTSGILTFSITNPSTLKTMGILINLNCYIFTTSNSATTNILNFSLQESVNGGGYASINTDIWNTTSFTTGPTTGFYFINRPFSYTHSLAAGATVTLAYKFAVLNNSGGAQTINSITGQLQAATFSVVA